MGALQIKGRNFLTYLEVGAWIIPKIKHIAPLMTVVYLYILLLLI
jgi:hypothetical protein